MLFVVVAVRCLSLFVVRCLLFAAVVLVCVVSASVLVFVI